MMTLEHKKIVIAGGTSGIGLSTALLFLNKGASVTVTGRDAEKRRSASAKGLQTAGVDSTNPEALQAFFQSLGNIDHLVISLGSNKGLGNFMELSLDDLRKGFEEKYWPHLNTLKSAIPFMNPAGSITLVTAITATAKFPGTSGIGSVNGALEMMVPIIAKEIAPVRINAVSPGVVDTPWWDFMPADSKQQAFEGYASQIAVGRIGRPEDIAHAILFLARNDYMTGKILPCDGGLS
ncbi:SDR family oxidoreductase [Siphonobacter sp. SORGH_AS_1065]|uniref:SDR family oxidoreductase n=1 Tax=Siphonobacter sp. SORGH_AS_1065 TaxID=3041795 RepID=UPI0027D7D79F|nr:SDR family oxidoreductase [Siphonobacter sp. SORGH_AS_1065]